MATDDHQDGTFQPYRQEALSISACHVWPPIGSDHHHHITTNIIIITTTTKTITGRHIVHRVGVLPQQAVRCCLSWLNSLLLTSLL